MRKSNLTGKKEYSERVGPLVRLWLLRLLVPMGGGKNHFIRGIYVSGKADGEISDLLAETFDTRNEWRLKSDGKVANKKALNCLYKLYKREEKTLRKAKPPKLLARNVKRLSKLAGLSATDCRILEFTVLMHSVEVLGVACDLLGSLSLVKLFKVLSGLLAVPEAEIRSSLSKKSGLSRSGLVVLDRDWMRDELKMKLTIISPRFAEVMVSSDAEPVALMQDVVPPSTPPHLTIDDFPHKSSELDILLPYLRKSLHRGRRGINILMYGAPGTGKSQLARILAKETGSKLFEVASENEEGEPLTDKERLRSFHAAQALLSGENIIILFDEIEDVFDAGIDSIITKIFDVDSGRNPKAWLNQRLEENRTPTLWLANSIDGMHPAFKRRFDMIVKMPVPPKMQRQKIIRSSCENLLSEQDIERISNVDSLAPAVVTRAASVVDSIRDELAQTDQTPALELIINNTLEAQGHERVQRHDPNLLPETYDPAFIHSDTDIEGIAEGLKRTKAGRLCLYGPPGTGKTAYVRWLSEQLEIPLLVKRGSDLMSMWVGGTEKNIAESFRQAETEDAILLIDEIEGFLQDRREARHSWEVTGVNEMLTRMEGYPGIFIASTNLLDSLDQAALRRFDMKIKFDYLLPRQSQALLESHCKTLNLVGPDKAQAAYLGRLRNLTPGDFAAVVRRHRFKPMHTAAEMVSALDKECSHKENSKHPIGFC